MIPLPLAVRAMLSRLPARYDREQCEVVVRLALWRYAGPDTPAAFVLRIARCAVISELRTQDGGRRSSVRAQGLRRTQSYDASPEARPAEPAALAGGGRVRGLWGGRVMALVTIYSHGDELLIYETYEPCDSCLEFFFLVTERGGEGQGITLTQAQARYMAGKLLAWLRETEQSSVAAVAAHADGAPCV